MELINELVKKGYIDEEAAQSIEDETIKTKKTEEEIVLNKKLVSEDELFQVKSELLQTPLKEDVSSDDIDSDVLSLIHEDSAKHYKMIPISRDGNSVEVGMVYPEDLKAQEVLKFISKQKNISFEEFLIKPSDFEKIKKDLFQEEEKKEQKDEKEEEQPEPELDLDLDEEDLELEEEDEPEQQNEPEDEEEPEPEKNTPLIEKLEKEGYIDEETKNSLIEKTNSSREIEDIILEEGLVSEDELFQVKSELLQTPLKEDVSSDDIDSDVLSLIHEDSAKHYKMIPISRDGNSVEVGMVYPEDLKAQEVLKFISKQKNISFEEFLIKPSDFEKIKKDLFQEEEKKEQKDEKEEEQPEPELDLDLDEEDLELEEEDEPEQQNEPEDEEEPEPEKNTPLIEKLEKEGYIDEETKNSLIEKTNSSEKTEEEVLIEEKIVSENDLFKIKSKLIKTPFREDVSPKDINEEIFKKFTKEVIEDYKIVPIGEKEEKIEVGAVYPESEKTKETLELISNQEDIDLEIYLISFSALNKIKKAFQEGTGEFSSPFLKKLTEKGYIKKQKAKEIDKKNTKGVKFIEELILEEGLMSENDLFEVKSDILDIPIKSDINTETIMENVLKLIPEDSANQYKMVSFGKIGNIVEVGMVAPDNFRSREALRFLSRRNNFSYEVYLITLTTFKDIVKQYRTFASEVGEALEDLDIEITDEDKGDGVDMEEDIQKLAEEAPIVKIVTVLLRNAIEGKASDIHIEPTKTKLKVRFRVDGKLHASLFLPIETHSATIARIKILSGLKIDEQRLPQDGRFSAKMEGRSIDFRVSTFPTTLGEKIVIRSLDPTEGLKSMDELGVMGKNLEILKSSIKKPTGMTLVTGPTGSGKSTTLYASLRTLNNESVNIVTLEDPVEYFIDGVSQSQVNPDIGYVFSSGLRQILRQDPDIIMVGEIRDEETADLAVHASLTGHMVLSTLHTNNALGVIPRLIDMGVKPYLIPPAMNTAIAQRLVRRICDKCKEPIPVSEEMRIMINEELRSIPTEVLKEANITSFSNIKLYKAKGCRYCSEEGFVGRVGVYEALRMTPDLGEIIMKDPTEKELKAEAERQRMISLKQDGVIKAVTGYTTIEEVLRVTGE